MKSCGFDAEALPAGAVNVRRYVIAFPSAAVAFEAGDYAYAAAHAGDDPLLRGASLIMLGHYEGGMPYLQGRADPWSAYYRAVVCWGLCDNRGAVGELQYSLDHSHDDPACHATALALKRLVDAGPLRVLVQAKNEAPPSSFSIVEAMKRTSSEVLSVGFHANDDVPLESGEPLARLRARLPKGWVPSFYHCYQVESNLMPVGLESAPFPILGYVSDYDTRIQTSFFRAQVCDAMVVTGGVDHHELRRGIGLPCVVFPKAVGIWADAFARADASRKNVDVFCSGTTMSFYQQDKGRLMYRLMQLADRHRVRIRKGYLSPEQYIADTARSRIVFSFVRRQPVWSSRATDALAGGAVVLYQEGGGLDLFFSEEEGAVPYREDNLEQVVERVLSQWDERYAAAAARGRARALREFDLTVCMERYLKRLAILGATIDPSRRIRRPFRREVGLRYPPFARGGFVAGPERRKAAWIAGWQDTVRRLTDIPLAQRTANGCNILAYAHFVLGMRQWKPAADGRLDAAPRESAEHLRTAWRTFEEGVARFPEHVVLRFNWGRVACVLNRRREAHDIFQQLLSMSSVALHPLDEVFGDDFAGRHFPFRAYVDAVMRHLVTKDPRELRALLHMILATTWWYCGLLKYDEGRRSQAHRCVLECLRRFGAHPPHHDAYGDVPLLSDGTGPRWTEEVVSHLKEAWNLAPYNPGILRRVIHGLEQLGHQEEAETYRRRYGRIAASLEGVPVAPLSERAGRVDAETVGAVTARHDEGEA